jgi:hypothetical protein
MTDQKSVTRSSIELSEEVSQGIYSNLAIITHSSAEFVIDFVTDNAREYPRHR